MLISICIPAFKRTDFLKRLLDSIAVQTFRDYEVVLSDDSPGEEVRDFTRHYEGMFPLVYHRNQPALGTPANWNKAISMASGQWIKLMHDDDWFAEPFSLAAFADAAKEQKDEDFFFSAYTNVYEEDKNDEAVWLNDYRFAKLKKDTATLFAKNVIGPPSVVMVRNEKKTWYDESVKWVVDIDYYMRYLQTRVPVYIPKLLVNVGIHREQVTQYSFRVQAVEIPENFYLLEKIGESHLRDFLVYDAWWRIIRNLHVRKEKTVEEHGYKGAVPAVIRSMIRWQSFVPHFILRAGIFSKALVSIHYLIYRRTIRP